MTPGDEARMRALTKLIAEEKDHEKIKILAAELERLLSVDGEPRGPVVNEKPRGG